MNATHVDTIIDILEKDIRISLLTNWISARSELQKDIDSVFKITRESIKNRVIHNDNYDTGIPWTGDIR